MSVGWETTGEGWPGGSHGAYGKFAGDRVADGRVDLFLQGAVVVELNLPEVELEAAHLAVKGAVGGVGWGGRVG